MKAFSELTSASQVNNADILAISQENSGSFASKKTTVKDVTDLANLNIAEEYDSTSSYAADDYCMYESVLYKCTASTTGSFDPTKWTQVVVTDEMGSGGGGNANERVISYADYMALSEAEKMNNTTYYIYDINGDGSQFQPVIYSTEERCIGVWKDGRPLYEKTVEFGALPNNTTKTVSYNISDLDYFVKIQCVAHNQNGSRTIPFVDDAYKNADVLLDTISSSGTIRIIAHTDLSSLTGEVTLQYVKTTDVAGSGTWTPQGVPSVHYSTEEQIIGTWINGETLYQKTYNVTFSGNYFDVTIPTTHKIKKLDGGVDSNNYDNFIHLGYGTSANDMCGAYEYESGKIRFQNFFYLSRPNGWLTITYTKSS